MLGDLEAAFEALVVVHAAPKRQAAKRELLPALMEGLIADGTEPVLAGREAEVQPEVLTEPAPAVVMVEGPGTAASTLVGPRSMAS